MTACDTRFEGVADGTIFVDVQPAAPSYAVVVCARELLRLRRRARQRGAGLTQSEHVSARPECPLELLLFRRR